MTVIKVEGLGPVEIKGDAPDADELAQIQAALKAGGSRTGAPGPKENPEGETIASMDTSKAQGFSQGTPLEAARDLIHGKRWGEVLKAFSPSTIFAAIAPLSTGNPKARQEIIVQQVPGAKAVEDKNGNPMIELEGKRYYTAGGDVDVARAGAAVAGTLPLVLASPASVPGAALLAGGSMAGQSLAEDAVARAAGGKSQEIDFGKAAISGIVGILAPLGVGEVALPLAGRLFAAVRSGTPLTNEVLARMGLTAEQIQSLTPELRDTITTVARRTFNNPQAVGSAYRTELGKEAGVDLTRGEISGSPGQIRKEQILADTPGGPGQQTMQVKRAAQDQQLSQAQEMLRVKAGGGVPLTPDQAGAVLKGSRDIADIQAGEGVDKLYGLARDPLAVEAAGGTTAVPATHASQFGRVTRDALAGDDVGRIALGSEASNLTPNAAAALKAVDRWSQRAVGPRADLSKTGGPTGTVYNPEGGLLKGPPGTTTTRFAMDQPGTVTSFPDISWQAAEDLRQTLVGYQKAAARSGSKQDQDAVAQIIKSFDDHFGPLNPLYQPARAAHAERMSTFKPGGSPDQDSTTKAVLKALDGPEPGAAVMNTIFGPKVSKGEAVQMIDHLNERVFANQPEARDVIKEQALRRLQVDPKTGDSLSPQRVVTAMKKALEGDAELPIYQRLFSGEELAELRRRYELVQVLANSRTPINPPRSGLLTMATLKHLGGATGGAVIGEHLGSMIGMPGVGGAVGATTAATAANVIPRIQAARAVNPPANYGQAGLLGRPAMAAGLAAGQADQQGQLGPADRLMQNAWGLLGGP